MIRFFVTKERRYLPEAGFLLGLLALSTACAHAQSPASAPVAISENGTQNIFQQTTASSTSFLFGNPTNTNSTAPSTYGFSESFGGSSPQQFVLNGLSLDGSAFFTAPPSTSGQSNQSRQAINQTIAYRNKGLTIDLGYLNIDKAFTVDESLLNGSTTGSQSVDALKNLLSKAGQSGLNTDLNFDSYGNKLGLKYSSIADALQNQQQTIQGLSLEHDFNKAFNLSLATTNTDTLQNASGTDSHLTTDVLHLAYSPTKTGFLLDGTSTRTLTDQGGTSNDLLLKVADHFSTINLTSQFESSQTASAMQSSNGWNSQQFGLTSPLGRSASFSGQWSGKTVQGAPGSDDFDAVIKAAETQYLEMAAEYAKTDDTPGSTYAKENLTAKYVTDYLGPLEMLTSTLAISNQQVPLLDGLQTASAGVQGIIRPINKFDFIDGAKFYLAYASDYSTAPGSRRSTHSARTLRLVSAPTGKNGLSWTVSQQQRLDQNGQPMRTASDYEAKYTLNAHLAVGLVQVSETPQPDGSVNDDDQRSVNVTWSQSTSEQLLAQYIHSKSLAQDIASEDGYYLTYSGPLFASKKVGIGLGESQKSDPTGANAFGTTANVTYGWSAGDNNQLNLTSNLTDWQNHGFDGTSSPSVEENGQLKFQTSF